VANMKITVFVAVGSGVSVFRGVGVTVAVGVTGIAATVCVDAAFAVCAMNVLIAPESSVWAGGAAEKVGTTQAMAKARSVNQSRIFNLRFDIYLTHNHSNTIELDRARYFSTMIAT